ncbi:MAG: hypothetical protein SPI52_05645 [Bacilli bacterium]|nr:hypothetical protein [Bacilli bacterium]
MKKVDEGEYFNAKLENNFSEFKVFKAEQYYTFEKSPSPEEVVSFSESFSSSKDRVAQNNNSTNNDSFDKLNKKLEQMNSNSGSESSTSSSSSLSSSTSSTTSSVSTSTSSLASSTSASSVASVGATGASVATVAVASVAAVVIMGGVLIDVKPYIETTKGTDYVILTIDADKIKKANEVNNSIETENYSINIENNQSIKLQKGKQKYLITGLEPSTSYKYTLDCPDLKLGGSSTVYSSTFTTSENIEVSGVYDERNCSIVFDEASKSATYSFSLYLSDYEKQYENVSLYLTYEAVDQASDIQNYIALYDVMGEDNYFKNEIVDLRYKDVYMYMIGDKVDGTSNNDLLFSHHVEIDYPSHWGVDEIPAFEVKASSEIDRSSPTQVKLQGEFTRYDDSYDLMCRVSLYDENDASLLEDAITPLQVGTSSYSFSLDAMYGTKKYKYVIYTLDKNNNEIILYTSPLISYTASQAYQASYTKVAPQDASIAYFSDHVEIEVNSSFASDYDNFEYRLEVLNSSSQVCGYYQGRGTASITINDISSLDEINFKYYDIGHFIDQDVTYNSSLIQGGKYGLNIIQITDGTQVDVSTETEIVSIGEFVYYDDAYPLYARVTLNIEEEDGISTVELFSPLYIEGQTYQIIVDAHYGVQDYQYIIYMLDANDQEVVLFTSPSIMYTASQAYQASYSKVEPLDATISYFSDHVEIEVAPTYISSSNAFEYRLEVLNSSYQVCGYYQGTENAIITINNVEVLDEINFIYYDIGHFSNKDVIYKSYSYSSGKEFCLPTIQMGEALGFDGTNFTLDYSISIADTYVIESIDLVVNDGTTDYTKNILSPAKTGTIALDHVEGALGEVGITLQLKFKDNQNDNNSHSLSSQATSYTMNYEFEVTKTIADSFSASTTLPIDLYFNYRLPTSYSISIKDEANAVDITTGLAESYYLNTITPSSDINLVVQPLDESSNPVLQATTIHISSKEAKSIFKSTPHSLNAVNPMNALITYNDDGTINMYRKTNFSCEDTRISLNAFIYETSSTGEDGKTIYQNGHDSIESNGYSIIEDIPSNMYIFNYYIYFDYENVRYISFREYPSGTAGPSESIGSYEVSTASGENTIKVNISSYGYLENRIVVNGVEYQFTTYTSMTDSTASLTLPEQEITSVKVYFTEYGSSYETVASEIPIKGNKFKEYTL